jgi:hypothetical protein
VNDVPVGITEKSVWAVATVEHVTPGPAKEDIAPVLAVEVVRSLVTPEFVAVVAAD